MDETPPIFDDDHPQYLAHSLVPNAGNMPFMAELPGHRLTTPENRTQWPPTSLFDIVYAGVVWSHFGVKELIPQLRSYHPDSKTARERQKEHLDHEALMPPTRLAGQRTLRMSGSINWTIKTRPISYVFFRTWRCRRGAGKPRCGRRRTLATRSCTTLFVDGVPGS